MLSKSLSTSEKRAQLHDVAGPPAPPGTGIAEFAQQLYPLLVAHADDFGREAGDLFTVMHAVDPSSKRQRQDFSAALSAMVNVGLIAWYDVPDPTNGTRKCIQILNFEPHQTGLHKRTQSRFPPDLPGSSGNFPAVPSQQKGTEGKGTEQNGKELNRTSAAPRTARPPRRSDRDPNPRTADQNVEVITAIVKELLPLGLKDGDLIEATKVHCAKRHVAYDGVTVRKAIDSAMVRGKRR